jgi:hypothetical protein
MAFKEKEPHSQGTASKGEKEQKNLINSHIFVPVDLFLIERERKEREDSQVAFMFATKKTREE